MIQDNIFGENKSAFTEGLEKRLRDCGLLILQTGKMNGYSNWEIMAACGTHYINYLRNSDKRELAIRDAEEFVRALKHEVKN